MPELSNMLRQRLGAANAAIAHAPDGKLDIAALKAEAAAWPGLDGMDLAIQVTGRQTRTWNETSWRLGSGYGAQDARHVERGRQGELHQDTVHSRILIELRDLADHLVLIRIGGIIEAERANSDIGASADLVLDVDS